MRCELAKKLKINSTEKILYNYWSNFISSPDQATTDATCYESELRYPSIQKLLWEAVDWLYHQLRKTCRVLGIKMIRSKYRKWKPRYHSFSKMRRKTKKKRVGLIRALLKLLKKFIGFESQLRKEHDIGFTVRYYRRVASIKIIYQQQEKHFRTAERIKNRIVSISKDYIRPIVRCK